MQTSVVRRPFRRNAFSWIVGTCMYTSDVIAYLLQGLNDSKTPICKNDETEVTGQEISSKNVT